METKNVFSKVCLEGKYVAVCMRCFAILFFDACGKGLNLCLDKSIEPQCICGIKNILRSGDAFNMAPQSAQHTFQIKGVLFDQ